MFQAFSHPKHLIKTSPFIDFSILMCQRPVPMLFRDVAFFVLYFRTDSIPSHSRFECSFTFRRCMVVYFLRPATVCRDY